LLLCKSFPEQKEKRTGKVTKIASALYSNVFLFYDLEFDSVFKPYYIDILTAKAIQKLSKKS